MSKQKNQSKPMSSPKIIFCILLLITAFQAWSQHHEKHMNILDNTGNTTGGYLNNLSFQEYANQGGNGFVGIEDSGTTFSLTGNNWSNTDTVYNITADTVLEFEFMSTREGEVHGIGFDEDNNIKNGKRIFALFGTENLRQNIQVESRYTTEDLGTWVHFTLPVGSYYTGQDLRLVLANDNDKTAGTSWFRNIKLTE